jgi:hypothetical protein
VCFFFFFFFLSFNAHHTPLQHGRCQRKPTEAHSRYRRTTKTEKGPKRRVWRRLGPRCFFLIFFSSVLMLTTPLCSLDDANESPWRPTAATEGP